MATINGQQVDIKNTSLLDYIVSNGFDADRLAVEVNGDIVKRGTYGGYIINEYDKIEIVCSVGGG